MRHCHFHFFRKIRFSLCLSLFLIGLGIFCAAVCKCADSDTWIVQFLTNPQADSGKSSSEADAPDAASASDASSENTTALNAAFTDYVTELFRPGSFRKSAEPSLHTGRSCRLRHHGLSDISRNLLCRFSCPGCSLC